MKFKTELDSLDRLKWRIACAMDFAKGLTSPGSYEYGNLEVLEWNLREKVRDIKKRLEDKDESV